MKKILIIFAILLSINFNEVLAKEFSFEELLTEIKNVNKKITNECYNSIISAKDNKIIISYELKKNNNICLLPNGWNIEITYNKNKNTIEYSHFTDSRNKDKNIYGDIDKRNLYELYNLDIMWAKKIINIFGYSEEDIFKEKDGISITKNSITVNNIYDNNINVYAGDVNQNRIIDQADSDIILAAVAKNIKLTYLETQIADADGDGDITTSDAGKVLRMESGQDEKVNISVEKNKTLNIYAGDVNQDGVLDEEDKEIILNASSEIITLTDLEKKIADVNQDGKIQAADASAVLRMVDGTQEKSLLKISIIENRDGIIKAYAGDVNQDWVIDEADVNMILDASINKITLTVSQKIICDINQDGMCDSGDAILVKQIITGDLNKNITTFKIPVNKDGILRVYAGDVNQDNIVDGTDSQMILSYIAQNSNFTDLQQKIADANQDGKINAGDSGEVLQIANGKKEKILLTIITESIKGNIINMYAGDINGDGIVSSADSLIIQKALENTFTLTDFESKIADVDNDGKITSLDVDQVRKIAIGTYDKELLKIIIEDGDIKLDYPMQLIIQNYNREDKELIEKIINAFNNGATAKRYADFGGSLKSTYDSDSIDVKIDTGSNKYDISLDFDGKTISAKLDSNKENDFTRAYIFLALADEIGQFYGYKESELAKTLNSELISNYTLENEGFEIEKVSETIIIYKIDITKKVPLADFSNTYFQTSDLEKYKEYISGDGSYSGNKGNIYLMKSGNDGEFTVVIGESGALTDNAYKSLLSVIKVMFDDEDVYKYFKKHIPNLLSIKNFDGLEMKVGINKFSEDDIKELPFDYEDSDYDFIIVHIDKDKVLDNINEDDKDNEIDSGTSDLENIENPKTGLKAPLLVLVIAILTVYYIYNNKKKIYKI